jgi:hypothetical protein
MPSAKHAERRGDIRVTQAPQNGSKRLDPLRRFAPMACRISLQLLGRTVSVETNSPKILELTRQFFVSYPQVSQGETEFRWRIVSESGGSTRPGARTSAFSDRDLSFVNMGQRSFLAVDAETRLGIAFLDERFAEASEPRLIVRPPLGILLCMSAASLGLTSLSAACVALGEEGVLLLGEPNSGKTTASYVAARLGMEFFADQLVFLECAASRMYAWGDPFPAVFRPATLNFYPELRSEVRASSYGDVRFLYFDKSKLQRRQAHRVMPVCSVLLQRSVAAEPRLVPLATGELSRHLAASLLFKDGDRFQSQHAAVFEGLAKLPSYRLSYGENPATAATVVRDLLVDHAREHNR